MTAETMTRAGVVGAGLMGSEIAFVYAMAGYDILLADRDETIAQAAIERLAGLAAKQAARGFYSEEAGAAALARIRPTGNLEDFGDRDFVTEAVFEDIEVKAGILRALEASCSEGCLIATNTSTIPISSLAASLSENRRANFVGMHYFSPVSRMQLVEVIPGFDTAAGAVEAAIAHARAAGKSPIPVKDVAGFAVNRMLHMFIIEAVKLVEEGVATPADLDLACRLGLGHAMGPFELMDAVTSSLCVQAQEIMQDAYGERFRPPALLKQRVKAGFTGGRGKRGWRSEEN
jgi:3-hydroxybutyryl-CoA dehydrogenase